MIISRITTHILRAPIPERTFYSSQAAFPERNSLLVKIEADNGLVGWGEGGQYGPPGPVASCINDVLAPLLLRRRADQPTKTWEQLYAFARDFGRQSAYVEAISAVDIALWDLWGQSLGQPVHALLGGAFRDRVTAYATGGYYGTDYRDGALVLAELGRETAAYAASGFGILKMKVGLLPVEADAERVAVVRRTVGDNVKLLADANHAYNAATAIRMATNWKSTACSGSRSRSFRRTVSAIARCVMRLRSRSRAANANTRATASATCSSGNASTSRSRTCAYAAAFPSG
jgi:D-galactarolactone cycloisomerase